MKIIISEFRNLNSEICMKFKFLFTLFISNLMFRIVTQNFRQTTGALLLKCEYLINIITIAEIKGKDNHLQYRVLFIMTLFSYREREWGNSSSESS